MYTPKGEIDDKLYEVIQREDVMKKISELKTPQEVYDVLKSEGVNITFEELEKSVKIGLECFNPTAEGNAVLSDTDLDKVAGGSKQGARDFFHYFWTTITEIFS